MSRSNHAKRLAAAALDTPERLTEYLMQQLDYVNRRYLAGRARISRVRMGAPSVVQHNGLSGIPAAELRPREQLIVMHLALPGLNCPQYVYRYLLFHECLHQIFPPRNGSIHHPEFRAEEKNAPRRAEALHWLRAKRFAVMGDE